jgi:hypothetical protein
MTRDEIIAAIRREHILFLTSIAGIPDEMLENEYVMQQWTIKDMLGHIAMWMRVACQFVADYKKDGVPKSLGLDNDGAVDAINAQGRAASHVLSLKQVMDEFAAAYGALIDAVQTLSDAELNAQLPAPWKEGDTLERLIAINSYEHEPEHTEQVGIWRENEEHDHDE